MKMFTSDSRIWDLRFYSATVLNSRRWTNVWCFFGLVVLVMDMSCFTTKVDLGLIHTLSIFNGRMLLFLGLLVHVVT